jgi:MinD superfamily P-loop ATPase
MTRHEPPIRRMPFGAEQTLPAIDLRTCTLCGDCVRACPTECLKVVDSRNLAVIPQMCIQCDVCAAICPERAIRMIPASW